MSPKNRQAIRRAKLQRRAKRVAARNRRREAARRRWRWDADGVLAVGCAAAFLAVAAWMLSDIYLLQRRGEIVPATVLNVSTGRNASVEVRYTTLAGRTLVDRTSNFRDATVGGIIDVVYDSRQPTRMQAADYGFDYLGPGLLTVGGVVALGVAAKRFYRRGERA